MKSKENRPLLTQEEPNTGRVKVRKYLTSCCSATDIKSVQFLIFICNFLFCLTCSPFSHWLLWFCSTTPPKPAPTSPASHHHSNQRASAAGLFTGRAPKTKALSPVVQHHSQCLFQEMRLLVTHLPPSPCACSEHA